jgi:transcriptional regulator with XRE-family HTH domain
MANQRSPREVDIHIGNAYGSVGRLGEITQEGLAHRLGITFQQVQKYEKGSNRISVGRLHQIASIMSVPITFFFDGVNAAGKIDAPTIRATKFLATRQGNLIVDTFPRLGKRIQQAILDLIRAGNRW